MSNKTAAVGRDGTRVLGFPCLAIAGWFQPELPLSAFDAEGVEAAANAKVATPALMLGDPDALVSTALGTDDHVDIFPQWRFVIHRQTRLRQFRPGLQGKRGARSFPAGLTVRFAPNEARAAD
jgi:hypothetical protein